MLKPSAHPAKQVESSSSHPAVHWSISKEQATTQSAASSPLLASDCATRWRSDSFSHGRRGTFIRLSRGATSRSAFGLADASSRSSRGLSSCRTESCSSAVAGAERARIATRTTTNRLTKDLLLSTCLNQRSHRSAFEPTVKSDTRVWLGGYLRCEFGPGSLDSFDPWCQVQQHRTTDPIHDRGQIQETPRTGMMVMSEHRT